MRRSGGGTRRGLALVAVVAALTAGLVACTNPPGNGGAPATTTLVPLPGPPGEFSLLSYNVAGLPQEVSKANPGLHLPLISPRLNAYDVVLTQENFDWWQPIAGALDFANYFARVRKDVTHPYRSGQHPGPFAVGVDPSQRPLLVGDGLGMLARYPFTEPVRVPWADCFGGIVGPGAADCLSMKGFSMATMTLADGRTVDVYNLHAEAGSDPQDQVLQVADYRQLAAFINTFSVGRAVVLAGDTNLHTTGAVPEAYGDADARIWQEFLTATGLTDTCVELSCPELSSIDKGAYRDGGGVDLTVLSHTYPQADFLGPEGEDLSDHLPLALRFAWADAPA